MIPGLEILNLHAQGGMAEVYRAKGKGADGRVWFYAVKRILPELTQDATLRQMFVEEARIASMLVHPNIVRVYDLARGANDDYYIVMEFLEGRDLAETIDKAHDVGRSLPVWLCIHAAREVLHALMYATVEARDREGRALGLIHRDISPHNIFLCFDGQVKLTDFGVAKVAQSNVLTQVGVTKGKFGYMSPEQLLSEKLDFRSDLFNVGILLYETLTGRRLFFGDNPSQFLQAMLRAEVPPLDPKLGVPAELEALMRRALSKERTSRPASAAAFDEELRAIAERYRLVATREHLAGEIRAIFGSEIESCPVPQARPATAPKMLASVQAAQPEVVRRVPSRIVPVQPDVPQAPPVAQPAAPLARASPSPAAARPSSQLMVPQQRTRSLSDPSVDVRLPPVPAVKELSRPIADVRSTPSRERGRSGKDVLKDVRVKLSAMDARATPIDDVRNTIADADERIAPPSSRNDKRVVTRPQTPGFASAMSSGSGAVANSKAPRPGTRSVRALNVEDGDDPATIPPDSLRDDPSTIPPDAQKTPLDGTDVSSLRGPRKPTVIVVGSAGAKPIGDADDNHDNDSARHDDDRPTRQDDAAGDWADAGAKASVVTRSAKVVPLPSKKR